MRAIQTKYIGPTNTKPSRIKAWIPDLKPIYYSCSSLDCYHKGGFMEWHDEAARKYAADHAWLDVGHDIVGAVIAPGHHCHTIVPKPRPLDTGTNSEGLTFIEWLSAAGRTVPIYKRFAYLAAAWQAGEDPTEWRAEMVHAAHDEP